MASGSSSVPIIGRGTVTFLGPNGDIFRLADCLHIPQLRQGLIGGTRLLRRGFVTSLTTPTTFEISRGSQVDFRGSLPPDSNLMAVNVRCYPSPAAYQADTDDARTLHLRLGHPNPRYLKSMIGNESAEGLSKHLYIPTTLPCNSCGLAKGRKLPHSSTRTRAIAPLENIHLDLSGIIRTSALCGSIYFILFTDDLTSYRHVAGMTSKDADTAFEKIGHYIALVERQCDRSVKKITLDNGSEFINHLLVPHCHTAGIYLRTTAAYMPTENGVAERSNLTIVSKARAMMIHANIPIRFWLHAIKAAVYLINRTVTSSLLTGQTPYELWYHRKPDLSHIRKFGCSCTALIHKELRQGKFAQVLMRDVLIGHTEHNHNYIIFLPETNTIVTTHLASFQEHIFPFRQLKPFDISQ